jgi:acetoin utilization protein AcuC
MSSRKSAFLHSSEVEKFRYPPDCPFKTQRAGQTRALVASLGLLTGDGRSEVAPRPATRAELEKFHSAHYLDILQSASEGKRSLDAVTAGLDTPDCPVFPGLYEYACLAAGATLTGAELILSGQADTAFNPSGGYHHAHAECAAGFCYVNDMALACLKLVERGKRVLYLDLDAHHCDGVQEAFYERADVMTISFHESGRSLFPGTGFENEIGSGAGRGYCVNVPLPISTYDDAYLRAFHRIAPPLIQAFNPDMLVVELGMDVLAGDPLTHLNLTNNAHAEILPRLLSYGKPILATGGGGYNVDNTVRGWALAWKILADGHDEHDLRSGLGGVMLQSHEWLGGLQDRELTIPEAQRRAVDAALEATTETVIRTVFPIHGLKV